MTTRLEMLRRELEHKCEPFYEILRNIYGLSNPAWLIVNGQLTQVDDGLDAQAKQLIEKCKQAIRMLRERYREEMIKLLPLPIIPSGFEFREFKLQQPFRYTQPFPITKAMLEDE